MATGRGAARYCQRLDLCHRHGFTAYCAALASARADWALPSLSLAVARLRLTRPAIAEACNSDVPLRSTRLTMPRLSEGENLVSGRWR